MQGTGNVEEFERKQSQCLAFAQAFTQVKDNPLISVDAMDYVKEHSGIEEIVTGAMKGDDKDVENVIKGIAQGIEWHKKMYGTEPSESQLIEMGSVLSCYANNTPTKNKIGTDDFTITESVDFVGTKTDNISILPYMMVLSSLTALMTISSHFCNSVPAMGATDKMTIYELFEEVGANPYGITEGQKIDGSYDGGLSNTARVVKSIEPADGIVKTFTAELDFPILPNKVYLYVNKRKVAADSGAGNLNMIGDGTIKKDGTKIQITASSINYWNTGTSKSTLSVTFAGAVPAALEIAFKTETNVEEYPAFVGETKYNTKAFDVTSSANMIRTGITHQAVLKSLRNYKMNVKDIAFSRLGQIMNADTDKHRLSLIRWVAEAATIKESFSTTIDTSRNELEQWARVGDKMSEASFQMSQNTDGKATINNWIVDAKAKLFFEKLGKVYFTKSPISNRPEVANQPHFVGTFHTGEKIWYDPNITLEAGEKGKMLGVGKGTKISHCPVVTGVVTPALPVIHGKTGDMAHRCTMYEENINDITPEAYEYTAVITFVA